MDNNITNGIKKAYDERINVQVGEFVTSNSGDVHSLNPNQMKEEFLELLRKNNELAQKNGEGELIIDEEKYTRRL